MEKMRPPVAPTAKENQKGELLPSMKKGMRPKTVENMVRNTAMILWL